MSTVTNNPPAATPTTPATPAPRPHGGAPGPLLPPPAPGAHDLVDLSPDAQDLIAEARRGRYPEPSPTAPIGPTPEERPKPTIDEFKFKGANGEDYGFTSVGKEPGRDQQLQTLSLGEGNDDVQVKRTDDGKVQVLDTNGNVLFDYQGEADARLSILNGNGDDKLRVMNGQEGDLSITDRGGNDDITVDGAQDKATSTSIEDQAGNDKVRVNTGNKNDRVLLTDWGGESNQFDVNTGEGNDTVNVASLEGSGNSYNINTAGGDDNLQADIAGDGNTNFNASLGDGNDFSLQIFRGGTSTTDVDLGAGDDVGLVSDIDERRAPGATRTNVRAGDGNDDVRVALGNGVQNRTDVDLGAGDDKVAFQVDGLGDRNPQANGRVNARGGAGRDEVVFSNPYVFTKQFHRNVQGFERKLNA